MDLESNNAVADQVELVGGVAFMQQVFPSRDTQIAGAAGDRLTECGTEPGKKRMFEDNLLKSCHCRRSAVDGWWPGSRPPLR